MASWKVGGAGWGRVSAEVTINTSLTGRSTRQFFHTRLREIDQRIVAEARTRVPIRTGHLAASIKADPVRTLGPWHVGGGVTAHARYAVFVHEGTRPHIIRARRVRALHFYWERMGEWVFFRHVNHPGNAPNPFLRDATRHVISQLRG